MTAKVLSWMKYLIVQNPGGIVSKLKCKDKIRSIRNYNYFVTMHECKTISNNMCQPNSWWAWWGEGYF